MKRREFLAGAGVAAAAAVGASAQPAEQVYRVGIIVPGAVDDARYQTWIQIFRKALSAEGGIGERNVRFEVRFATDSAPEIRKQVAELRKNQTSFSHTAPRQFGRCCKPHVPSLSCFRLLPIQWAPVLSAA